MPTDLLARMTACTSCALRGRSKRVVGPTGSGTSLFVLLDQPDRAAEEANDPLAGRSGEFLRRLLGKAGFGPSDWYITHLVKCAAPFEEAHLLACKGWAWKEIKEVAPKVVLALGKTPCRVLSRANKSSFRLSDVVGKIEGAPHLGEGVMIACWHGPCWLSNQGETTLRETALFFRRLKDYTEVS